MSVKTGEGIDDLRRSLASQVLQPRMLLLLLLVLVLLRPLLPLLLLLLRLMLS